MILNYPQYIFRLFFFNLPFFSIKRSFTPLFVPNVAHPERRHFSHSIQTDSQTIAKLQHMLFYRFQYVHSNTILISKFCHLSACGNLGIGATSMTLQGLSYDQNIF